MKRIAFFALKYILIFFKNNAITVKKLMCKDCAQFSYEDKCNRGINALALKRIGTFVHRKEIPQVVCLSSVLPIVLETSCGPQL